jgi:PPOX class probable F420-dependent enzyme
VSNLLDLVPESHADLLRSPFVGALATIDPSGGPQVTAVWYLLADGVLKGSITSDRAKYRNLRANPACTLLIVDPSNQWRTLEIRADAELEHDPDKIMADPFGVAYGVDPEMLRASGDDRWTITFRPRKVVAIPKA